MATQIILLERIERLGDMGAIVNVKPGYARNYLLPSKKALRASKANIAYFEAQKKNLAAESDKKKKEAEKLAKTLSGLKVPLIRQASESGQLFGSVTSRDIAAGVTEASKENIERSQVAINQNFKLIGLFPVEIALHPEVKAEVMVNIARTVEEAKIQAKTGRAMISDEEQPEVEEPKAEEEAQLEEVLEEGALEAEKEKQAASEEKEAADAEKSAAKEEAKKAKAEAKSEAVTEEVEAVAEQKKAEEEPAKQVLK